MLTREQEEWVNSLSDRQISIVPYDPRTERLFKSVEKKIHGILGVDVAIEHCGASSLGISGQDEIDISIVTTRDRFADYVSRLDGRLGTVASWYEDRVRFKLKEDGKKIDLKVIDKDHGSYRESKMFEEHLRTHLGDLERYRILKEHCNGMTVKEYYRRKIEFINDILARRNRN